MPRQTPKVIAGMRSGRDLESMAEIERRETGPELPQVLAGLDAEGTMYCSKFPSYRVQITSPGDVTNPVTGQKTIQRGIVAMFKNGRYLNDGRQTKSANKKQRDEVRKMVDDTLQNNSRFGKPGLGDYWLASEQAEMVKEMGLQKARETLASLPREEVIAFVESLQKSDKADHDLTA